MEFPQRHPNRIEDYDYNQTGTYFVTICTQDRKPILSKIVGTSNLGCPQNQVLELLWHGQIADKYIRKMNAFYDHLSVDKYVIMPDHIHLLITIEKIDRASAKSIPPKRTSVIARFIGTFKRFCNKEYGANIWQSRFYDHVIRNEQDYNEIWEYIENNPQKSIITKQGRG